jgi:hypothetical protein
MTYAQKFLRLVSSGTLYGVEQFSWSLSLIDVEESASPPTVVPPAVIAAISTYHSSMSTSITQEAKLKTIKLNEIGVDGRYTRPNTVRHDLTVPLGGGSGGYPIAQSSICVSLATPIARGHAHAGRFYLPPSTYANGADGCLTSTAVNGISQATKTMLEAVNASLAPFKVAVMSNVGMGTYQIVTAIKLGRVVDTIRSRRTKLPEAYFTTALVGAT